MDASQSNSRASHLREVKSLVVKLGSQVLTGSDGLDAAFLASLARQVVALGERKIRVTIVSSGAVAAGVRELKLTKRPADLPRLQAVAAVGQRVLMDAWAAAFEPHGMPVAQVLLTREDVDDRTRFLNVRNTIHAAHELGAVPIINENDTISTDEIVAITFGDNDILAGLVTNALQADLLVLLTVVDGLLDANGVSVRQVSSIDEAKSLIRIEISTLGKGGMNSKLEAARMVVECGESMVVANGRTPDVLTRVLAGEDVGTLFLPSAAGKRSGRSRWISAARAAGSIVVDAGAVTALIDKKKSLLPAGVTKVTGSFEPGDVVNIDGPDGRTIARGLSNYRMTDIDRIRGKKTADVRALLGDAAYDEVVHRDNLVRV